MRHRCERRYLYCGPVAHLHLPALPCSIDQSLLVVVVAAPPSTVITFHINREGRRRGRRPINNTHSMTGRRASDGPPRHLQSKALRGNIFQAVSFPKDPQNKPSISPFTARPPAFSNARQEFAVRDKNPLLPRRFTGHQPRCSGRSITLCLSVGGARRRGVPRP